MKNINSKKTTSLKINEDNLDSLTVFTIPLIMPSFYIAKRHNANVGLMLKGNRKYVILSLFQFNPTRDILPWIRIINGNTTDLRWADEDLKRIHRMLPQDVDIQTAKTILLEIGPDKALKSILNAPENFKINYRKISKK